MKPLRHRLEGVVFVFYKLEKGQKKGDVLKLKRFRHKKRGNLSVNLLKRKE
ncbi:hypothetical protein HMPREF0794_1589 [Staphylococcus epidermidis M23864:W2(grey)]|jgi:hypothetical protein|nr:hypothetical protein HMPREF0789_1569 [Staphylococcus epidermidis BCM-HMP0060]EFE58619.1 hypothetical protein HMPREF0794_1589 [Staphylococcus epidermidis M23864:W2(grey)]